MLFAFNFSFIYFRFIRNIVWHFSHQLKTLNKSNKKCKKKNNNLIDQKVNLKLRSIYIYNLLQKSVSILSESKLSFLS